MESITVEKQLSIDDIRLFCLPSCRQINNFRIRLWSKSTQSTCRKIIKYISSFCKVVRAIGSCVDHYCPLRKNIKFYLHSTKLVGVLFFPERVKRTFWSVRNIFGSETVSDRIKYSFDSILGLNKILGNIFTVIKAIQTAERVNNILKYWLPYYDILNTPIDVIKIILKAKTVYLYSKLRSDLLALEKKANSGEDIVLILSQMLDRLTVEKTNSLQKQLYIPEKINLSEKINEYKKIILTQNKNEKTLKDITIFMKDISSRVRIKCYSDRAILINDIFDFVVTIVLFSFFVSSPACLVVPIITASVSLLVKSAKDIAFRKCV